MITTACQVEGMTRGHCVSAVTAEVSKVSSITGVQADLESVPVNASPSLVRSA
ncbi:hypothetical protein [Streptosporangium sp. CA-115845]|uniref:hypothetical protein n=1 Tax=Streptosporangium sp. CA-115845 TaxID=3240071 RepID=UPI003D8D9B4D